MISIKVKEDLKDYKKIFIIHPDIQPNNENSILSVHSKEMDNCIEKLKLVSSDYNPHFRILIMTIFVKSNDFEEYSEVRGELLVRLKNHYGLTDFPVLIVAQSPGNNNVAIEVMAMVKQISEYSYEYEDDGNISYCKIANGNNQEIYGAISSGSNINSLTQFVNNESIYQQSKKYFEVLNKILNSNNLDYGNIVRQWGYIGKITDDGLQFPNDVESKMENYQMFNMARAEAYKNYEWINGYPAATGIGTNVEGCSIEFIASNDNPKKLIIPLHNPKQSDAHRYSGKQFENNSISIIKDQAGTPKFERGKIVITDNSMDLYVSGTAAIIGEDSIPADIFEQTQTTLDNISILCSKENLKEHGIHIEGELPLFTGVRAYIKFPKDSNLVEGMCKVVFGDVPIVCIIADVCREELLVEIEAFLNCNIEIMNNLKV